MTNEISGEAKEVLLTMLQGGLWKVDSISEQPEVEIYDWQIKHMKEGDFFAGSDMYGGRVSTKIVTFDPEKKMGITTSGRVYKLKGEAVTHLRSDADYVWNRYKEINALTELD